MSFAVIYPPILLPNSRTREESSPSVGSKSVRMKKALKKLVNKRGPDSTEDDAVTFPASSGLFPLVRVVVFESKNDRTKISKKQQKKSIKSSPREQEGEEKDLPRFELPEEILQYILTFLPAIDLLRVRAVCTSFATALEGKIDELLKKLIFLRYQRILPLHL